MAVTATPIFPQTIQSTVQQILPADTTTKKTLYTAGANGSRVENIIASSTDTVLRNCSFYVTIGGTDYLLATVQVAAGAGTTSTIPPIAILIDSNFVGLNNDASGNKYLYLSSGAVLKVSTTTVTAAKAVQFFVQGGDY